MRVMRGNGDVRYGDKEVRTEAGGQRIEDNASPSCIRLDLLSCSIFLFRKEERGGATATTMEDEGDHLLRIYSLFKITPLISLSLSLILSVQE